MDMRILGGVHEEDEDVSISRLANLMSTSQTIAINCAPTNAKQQACISGNSAQQRCSLVVLQKVVQVHGD